MKTNLEKRVKKLEAQYRKELAAKRASENEAAWGRIRTVLDAALVSPPAEFGGPPGGEPGKEASSLKPKDFDHELRELHARMKNGTLTDGDKTLLDSLPRDDLAAVVITAQG